MAGEQFSNGVDLIICVKDLSSSWESDELLLLVVVSVESFFPQTSTALRVEGWTAQSGLEEEAAWVDSAQCFGAGSGPLLVL